MSFSFQGCFLSFNKLWEKGSIFVCKVLFIREEWLSLLTLLKIGLLTFSMLKTAFCEYWTSINIKISMTCVLKEYEIKTKMVQLKITFLLGYNLSIFISWVGGGGLTFGGWEDFYSWGENEWNFGWDPPSPASPSREKPTLVTYYFC